MAATSDQQATATFWLKRVFSGALPSSSFTTSTFPTKNPGTRSALLVSPISIKPYILESIRRLKTLDLAGFIWMESRESCYATRLQWNFVWSLALVPNNANGCCTGGIVNDSRN